ncbi:MAG: hypothetical protein HFH41_03570 [Lachnospiraceae bacterium]|nr:hypothetical protein [Lachnospiraceae bacterium]
MERELCFCIEKKELYLEQVLVDYMEIPIFFLCKNSVQYYLALCIDIDELNYIVTKASISEIYNLLHGKIPMRDVILQQEGYWDVLSGEEVSMDTVTKHLIGELNKSFLPEEGACFEILTEKMEEFVKKFDNEHDKSQKEFYEDGSLSIDVSGLNFEIGKCFDLGICLLEQQFAPEINLYEYCIPYYEEQALLKNFNNMEKWSNDVLSSIAV